jgi:hypothetical protein
MLRIGLVIIAFATIVAAAPVRPAEAQWKLLARRAIGRVQQMEQSSSGAGQGASQTGTYDVATVVLAADADKVYATAHAHLMHNPQVKIVSQDPRARKLELSNGVRTAGLSVTPLGPKLSQVLVASVRPPGDSSTTSIVVDGIMRVCAQMQTKCSLE